jgi:rhodanese-related sulfurtransferase
MPQFRNAPVDVVIDVRSKVEFWLGHLPGAHCVPVDTLPDGLESVAGADKRARLLVYCASGGRSAMARQILTDAGYTDVVDGGGISSARADFVE